MCVIYTFEKFIWSERTSEHIPIKKQYVKEILCVDDGLESVIYIGNIFSMKLGCVCKTNNFFFAPPEDDYLKENKNFSFGRAFLSDKAFLSNHFGFYL